MKIFYAKADRGGCGWYRCELPAKYLKLQGHNTQCRMSADMNDPFVISADIIVLQRQTSPKIKEWVLEARKRGQKVIYELDDTIWDIPFGSPARDTWTPEAVRNSEQVMLSCDAITTTTEHMQLKLTSKIKSVPVHVIPNYIEEPTVVRPEYSENIVTIGWAGSSSHIMIDFERSFIDAMVEIKTKYQDKLKIIFFGDMPVSMVGYAEYTKFVTPDKYLNTLQELNFDIGVAPVNLEHEQNKCRSNLKFLEYSICGAVTVASPIISYRNLPLSLVKKNRWVEWVKYLSGYIENKDKRLHDTSIAKEFVTNNYLIKDKIKFVEKIYKNILEGVN